MISLRKLLGKSNFRQYATHATHPNCLETVTNSRSRNSKKDDLNHDTKPCKTSKASKTSSSTDCENLWEKHHTKSGLIPYFEAQDIELKNLLEIADKMRDYFAKRPDKYKKVVRSLVLESAHQSAAFGGNKLKMMDAIKIDEGLETRLLHESSNIVCLESQQLADLELPSPESLLPGSNTDQVAVLRNQILLTRFLLEKALSKSDPFRIAYEMETLQNLCSITLRGTRQANINHYNWGTNTKLGDFRTIPASSTKAGLIIHPCPSRIPERIEYLLALRTAFLRSNEFQLHPLLQVTRMFVDFSLVHPFAAGNGRIGRALLADALVRFGFLPLVFYDVLTADYFKMMLAAQHGNPHWLLFTLVRTQAEMMNTIALRDFVE